MGSSGLVLITAPGQAGLTTPLRHGGTKGRRTAVTADFERAAADPCWRAAAARCETLPNPSSRFEEAPIPMMQHNTVGNRLLAVIAALLVVAALKASYPVTMPLAAAVLIVAAAWPLKPWLDQFLPSKLSYVGTVLALFLIFAAFLLAVYFSISRVAQAFAGRREQFVQMYGAYAAFASERGLPTLGEGGAGERADAAVERLPGRGDAGDEGGEELEQVERGGEGDDPPLGDAVEAGGEAVDPAEPGREADEGDGGDKIAAYLVGQKII